MFSSHWSGMGLDQELANCAPWAKSRPLSVFRNTVLLEGSIPISLHIVCGCFHSTEEWEIVKETVNGSQGLIYLLSGSLKDISNLWIRLCYYYFFFLTMLLLLMLNFWLVNWMDHKLKYLIARVYILLIHHPLCTVRRKLYTSMRTWGASQTLQRLMFFLIIDPYFCKT